LLLDGTTARARGSADHPGRATPRFDYRRVGVRERPNATLRLPTGSRKREGHVQVLAPIWDATAVERGAAGARGRGQASGRGSLVAGHAPVARAVCGPRRTNVNKRSYNVKCLMCSTEAGQMVAGELVWHHPLAPSTARAGTSARCAHCGGTLYLESTEFAWSERDWVRAAAALKAPPTE
jgi:hypothetical protein